MISAIIPAYKKTAMLVKNLRHNLPYLKGCEVIVVNDDPEKSIAEDLKEFTGITLIENKQNLGFGPAVNTGVKHSKHSHILLLNSDVILNDAGYISLLPMFKKNKLLFAVGLAQQEKDKSIVGKNSIYWKNGFFHHKKADDILPGITAWAEGGSCVIDRKKFDELGGFDRLYSPFYWEDIDLSYRAWKKGYEVFFDPAVVVEHHHESTIGSYFTKEQINKIALRNQLIFIWKNITDYKLLTIHLFYLCGMMAVGNGHIREVAARAYKLFGNILTARKSIKSVQKLSDREILDKFITI